MIAPLIVSAAVALTPALDLATTSPASSQVAQAAAADQTAPAPSPVVRENAEQWDVTSKITGRTYRIYVAKPVSKTPPPANGYPVVYLSDGDITFNTAADDLLMLSTVLEAKPALIVAVGYGKGVDYAVRTRFADLTPFAPDAATVAALEAAPGLKGVRYGEAEGYYRFLTEELRPQIEARYGTAKSDKILWGDSLGGLFALHVLFNHPEAFNTYLIGSPSIIWNNRAILNDEPKLTAPVAAGKVAPRVLFTAGRLEESVDDNTRLPPGVTREQMLSMMKAVGMITNIDALAARLKALKAPPGGGVQVETVVFDGETHVSALPFSISRGLRFALKP